MSPTHEEFAKRMMKESNDRYQAQRKEYWRQRATVSGLGVWRNWHPESGIAEMHYLDALRDLQDISEYRKKF